MAAKRGWLKADRLKRKLGRCLRFPISAQSHSLAAERLNAHHTPLDNGLMSKAEMKETGVKEAAVAEAEAKGAKRC